ncbi:serine-threonine protein kinase, putative, partial [Bodo saltans]
KLINEKNLANINLLGLFFVNGFVNERIVTNVLFILLYGPPDRRSSSRLPADFEVEMFLELLLKVGKNISQRTKQFLDQFIFTMTELSTYHPSKRIQLKLLHSLMIVHNGFELTNDIRGNENIAVKPKRSTPLFPHVSLGDVAVMASIGRGSSCVVHRCEWRGRTYALKQYHEDVVRDIAREVAVAPYLQHPSIVRVAAIVDSSDGERQTVGLLMELASLSLAGVLASHSRPSQATILRWLHEVAQGIEFAHECRVVHSDIKPENIMTIVHSQEHVVAKVTDFGSASILSTAGPATTTVRGTPMFIAPEYGAGDTGPTKASDVFSFGMTMWCALVPQGTDHGLGK